MKLILLAILLCQLVLTYLTYDTWRMDKEFFDSNYDSDSQYEDAQTEIEV